MVLMLALCHAVEATRQRSHRLGGYVRSTSDGRVLHIAATLQAGARRAALGGSPDVQARLCSCWRSDHASHGLRAVGVNPPVTRHPSYDCLEGGREGVRSAFYIHFDALACSALLKARLTIYGTAETLRPGRKDPFVTIPPAPAHSSHQVTDGSWPRPRFQRPPTSACGHSPRAGHAFQDVNCLSSIDANESNSRQFSDDTIPLS